MYFNEILVSNKTMNRFTNTTRNLSLLPLWTVSARQGQFLVLLNQSKQDRETLSAFDLDCICLTGLTAWSVSFPFHRTILLFLLPCKIMFPGPVGALPNASEAPGA